LQDKKSVSQLPTYNSALMCIPLTWKY